MIIYNVTSKVSAGIHQAWLKWMLEEHIPKVMATQCFINHRFVKLLDIEEDEGPTYAVQYTAENMESYKRYIADFNAALTQQSFEIWGDRFISFSTIMEVVQ